MALSKIKGTVIADNAINADRIADGTVVASDLLDNTLTGAKLATDIAITTSGNITTTGDLTVDTNTLYVDSSNNRVGILTDSPTVALTVAATTSTNFLKVGDGRANNPAIRFDDFDTSNNGEITLDNTTLRIEVDEDNAVASSAILFRADASERMRIDSSGNVGIGTSSPSTPLHISTSAENVATFASTDTAARIVITDGTDTGYVNVSNDSGTGVISIGQTLGLSPNNLNVDDSGNVGIGTGSPQNNLHISANEPKILLQSTAGSPTYAPVIATNGSAKLYGHQGRVSSTGAFASNHFLTEWDDANGYALSHRFHIGASSEKMRINSSGNVGIGTTVPDAKLSVNGVASFGDGTALLPSIANFGDLNTGMWFPAADTIAFSEGGVERIRIDSSGNLLVGTTSATIVYTGATSYASSIISRAGYDQLTLLSPNVNPTLSWAQPNSSAINYRYASIRGVMTTTTAGSEAGALTFFTSNAGATSLERMRIDPSGNVGIGTTNPSTKLEVWSVTASGSNADVATFVNPAPNILASAATIKIGASNVTSRYSYIQSLVTSGVNGQSLCFGTNANAVVPTEKMRIDSSGNVGIGTTSPASLFHIESDSADPTLRITNKTVAAIDTGPDIEFWNNPFTAATTNSYESGAIRVRKTSGSNNTHDHYMSFWTRQNSPEGINERMRIDSYGRLLIGTTTPYSNNNVINIALNTTNSTSSPFPQGTVYRKLNFQGSNAVAIDFQDFAGSRKGSIQFNEAGTSFNTSSDYRLKENVVEITDATTRLKQLKPKRFNFITDANTTVDGFIAHEVQDIVPEAITGSKDAMKTEEYEVTPAVLDDDGNVITEAVMGTREVPEYQGIEQAKLVPLLVKTIQELEARITALETTTP